MQNDKLRKAQAKIKAYHQKYTEFYGSAPVGYIVCDNKGLILDVSLAAAKQLAAERMPLTS